MKKVLFICLSFLISLYTAAQEEQFEELKQRIAASESDTQKVNLLIDLGKAIIDNNIDSTQKFAFEAIELAQKSSFKKGEMMAINLIGNVTQRRGQLDSAMIYYKQVEQIATELSDDKGMAIALSNKGIIHINKGEYVKALKVILEAVDYEIKLGDKTGMAEGYLNAGVVHYYMGDMDNTLKYFKKSTALTKEVGDLQVLKKGYINIGAIHQYRKEYDEALDYYNQAYDIAEELNDQNDINVTLHNMAQIYSETGQYELAESNFKKALEFHKKFKKERDIAKEYINLGSLYRNQKKWEKAKEYYDHGIELCINGGYLKELEDGYKGLSEMYSRTANYKKAFEASLDYIDLKDSLLNEENAKNVAELRTKYETAEKEKALAEEQIKSESLAKEAAEAKLSAANRNKWIITLIALIIAVTLSFLVLRQRNKRKAQAEKDAAIIEERDRGTQAVFEAQEEERKRISKDLHDGVGQQLSGLKMAFQKVSERIKNENPERSEELRKLSGILSESADEVRSISHQMMPKALTELGLIETLQDMLEKSFGMTDIQYEFDHFGINERLNENIEVSLYRVCQELINNILKHANATKITVQLYKNSGKVIMVVEDNGSGIKYNSKDGHGLLNMKSRINSLNGEINLEPSPKSGTLATVRLPL